MNFLLPGRGRTRCTRLAIGWLCVFVLVGGCRRAAAPVDPQGPAKLLDQIRLVHQERRYTELECMVDPARLTTLVRTLMAVDRLLSVSQQLRETAEHRVGPTAAEICNLGMLADYLGPFSRNVRVVSSRIDDGKAWVSYQVGERVPIERAQMRLEGERWVYVPDEADEKLPDVLRRLTDELVTLRTQAERGTYNERAFMDEYTRRIQEPLAAHLAEAEEAHKAKSAH